jgi:hypothetical protein
MTTIVDNLNFLNIKIGILETNSKIKLSKTNITLTQNIGYIIQALLVVSLLLLKKLKKVLNRF